MSARLPNGTIFAIAASYGSSAAMSAVSNASPGVATLADGHGVVTGDIMEVTSGWSRINNRIIKAGTVATDSVPLSGIDTTSTTLFPAGGGAGSVRKIASWQTIAQVTDTSQSGGDQQFTSFSYLEDDFDQQLPTTLSAQSMTLTVADDPTLPQNAVLQAANDDRAPRALRATLPNGGIIYYNVYVTFNPTPSLTKGQVMAVTITGSLLNRPVRY